MKLKYLGSKIEKHQSLKRKGYALKFGDKSPETRAQIRIGWIKIAKIFHFESCLKGHFVLCKLLCNYVFDLAFFL